MKLKNFQRKINLFAFFDDFLIVYPVYTILFLENGLSVIEVSYLLVIWAATALIFEIPLGIVSDILSRRQALLLSRLVKILAFSTWLVFPSFAGFASGFFLWGIAGALTSGTIEAYVFDELKYYKKTDLYEKVSGRMNASSSVGVAFALLFGGILAEYSFDLVLYMTIISVLISTVILYTMKDHGDGNDNHEETFTALLKKTRSELSNKKIVVFLIVIYAFIFGIDGGFDEYITILFYQIGFSKGLIGVLSFTGYISYALGGLLAGSGIRRYLPVWLVILVGIFTFTLLFFTQNYYAIILLFVLAFLYSLIDVWLTADIQREISSEVRATLLSIVNMGKELVGIFVLLSLGVIADVDIWNTLIFVAMLLMVPLALTVFYYKKYRD